MGLFSWRSQSSTVGVIDIGSSSIGVALVAYATDQKKQVCPNIIYANRKEILFDEALDFKRFTSALLSTLEQAVDTAVKQGGVPDRFVVFLPSPLYLATTKTVSYQNEQPFPVKQTLIADLASKAAEGFLALHPNLYPELTGDKTFVLENKSMQITLNGYEIKEPLGKKASTIALAQYASLSSTTLRKRFTETLQKISSRPTVEFHSYSFAIFSSLRDIISERNFLIIDISGELTDVMLVSQGILLETASFPLGRNFIIRSIATSFATVYSEAETILKLHTENKATPVASQRLEATLAPIADEWMTKCRSTLATLQGSALIPELIFIIGNDAGSAFIADWIKKDGLQEFTLTNKPIETKLIRPALLKSFCDDNPHPDTDSALLLESLFCVKISSKD